MTDNSGKVLQHNAAARKLLGQIDGQKAPEEWPRNYGFFQPDGKTLIPDPQSPLVRAIRGEEEENLEVFVKNKHCSGRWCSMNFSPFRQHDVQIEGAVLILQDITERKRLADAVSRSNDALQQFAWVAAHDLQEPLRSVTGFIDLLDEHLPQALDDQSKHYMSRVKEACKRMRNLITDLLAYSRIQTKEPVLKLVDCNELIADCIDSLHGSIDSSSAQVISQGLPTILADRGRLAQLFQNLVGNALKFSAPDRPPIVHISVERLAHEWLFSIEDNGVGIDMRFAERIFIAFQRLSQHTSASGTGIGLAICKKIVEQHDGLIWIESIEGKGTVVKFTLRADTEDKPCQS